jgi:hypothetical protein
MPPLLLLLALLLLPALALQAHQNWPSHLPLLLLRLQQQARGPAQGWARC